MHKLFKKELWKDIAILVILIAITFFRYTTFKEIKWFIKPCYIACGITVVYAFFYCLFNFKTNKERWFFIALCSLSLLFFYFKDILDVFIYFLVAAIFRENREGFLKYYFVTVVSAILIAMACYFLDVIPHNDAYRGEDFRYGLGFVNPNTVFRYFFGSLIALYVIDKKKMVFNVYGVGCGLGLYLLTDSRTGLICTMTFVIITNLGVILENKIEKWDLRYAYLFTTIFSFVFVFLFHDNDYINELLTRRPKFLYEVITELGNHVFYGKAKFLYCDNRMFYLVAKNSVFSLLLTNVFYYLVFKKEKSVSLKVIFVMSLIYGFAENFRSLGQTMVPVLCIWSLYDNYIRVKLLENDKNRKLLTNNDNKQIL